VVVERLDKPEMLLGQIVLSLTMPSTLVKYGTQAFSIVKQSGWDTFEYAGIRQPFDTAR
jgi:hypothetical protein